MKTRGMLFNDEMVRAILADQKTQTRRIIKPQYSSDEWSIRPAQTPRHRGHTHDWWLPTGTQPYSALRPCPYGVVGDRITVREAFSLLGNEDACAVDWNDNIVMDRTEAARIYRASCEQRSGDYGLWSIPDEADWKPRKCLSPRTQHSVGAPSALASSSLMVFNRSTRKSVISSAIRLAQRGI